MGKLSEMLQKEIKLDVQEKYIKNIKWLFKIFSDSTMKKLTLVMEEIRVVAGDILFK